MFEPSIAEILVYLGLSLFFSIFSFLNKSFSIKGIIFGNLVGFLVFVLGGLQSFSALTVFFVLGEFATSYCRKKNGQRHEQRTSFNIVGNAGAGAIALLFSNYAAFFGSISAALSDTLSSEIGLLSKKKPRLITTMEEVEPGTDGGVTLLGFGGAIIGAFVISTFFFFFFGQLKISIFIFLAGLIGAIADSFLGAVLQKRKVLDNNQVNFIATATGAVVVLVAQVFMLGF